MVVKMLREVRVIYDAVEIYFMRIALTKHYSINSIFEGTLLFNSE